MVFAFIYASEKISSHSFMHQRKAHINLTDSPKSGYHENLKCRYLAGEEENQETQSKIQQVGLSMCRAEKEIVESFCSVLEARHHVHGNKQGRRQIH